MTITISTTISSSYSLPGDRDNTVTITAAGNVSGTGSPAALYGYGLSGLTFMNASWTLTNAGTVSGTSVNGIQLGDGANYVSTSTITNQTGGHIGGSNWGVHVYSSGPSNVVNQTGATISGVGSGGVVISDSGGTGTVTNSGLITAPTGVTAVYGVEVLGGGSVVNEASGTIQGYQGVYVSNTGTITNAGTIIAGTGVSAYAVAFANGASSSRLIVDPGAVFTGALFGGTGVIELASAASAGALSGFGVSITNFSVLQFDTNASWTVTGNSGAAGLGTIAVNGFDAGDTIDLTGFAATGEVYGGSGLVLTNAMAATTTIAISGGTYTTGDFTISSDGSGGTFIVDCFAAGTRIGTGRGSVVVDDLVPGDLVHAHFAGLVPVRWIGRRQVACSRHPDPRKVWPVRVAAGAFGVGMPNRDLLLSPNHGVFVRGSLIPVHCLINDVSIVQMPVDEVTYFHVELAQHDLLLAEGVLAESYLDVGDRSNFTNGGARLTLHPDLGSRSPDVAAVWETLGCAPLIIRGPRLEAARRWVNGLIVHAPLPTAA